MAGRVGMVPTKPMRVFVTGAGGRTGVYIFHSLLTVKAFTDRMRHACRQNRL